MGIITYNATRSNVEYIFRATNGGTVFSANLAASTTFDYFLNNAVVNDAIYFGGVLTPWSNLYLNVGTPIVGNGLVLVWEYYCYAQSQPLVWRPLHDLTDGSNSFTTPGAVTVDFPIQVGWRYTTLNGVAAIQWVRCRIASLTSISEGGANSTSRVQRSDGWLRIESYTDAAPCTWSELYNWVVANAPKIGAHKFGGNVFKFDNANVNIASRLRSTNECIYIGNGGYNSFNTAWLHSGTKVGDSGWQSPSHYFISILHGASAIIASAETKVYGGVWDFFDNTVDGVTTYRQGYLNMGAGEWIGVFAPFGGYFKLGAIDRCIVNGNLVTSSKPEVYPTRLGIADPKTHLWTLYGNGLEARDVSYSLPSTALCLLNTQNHTNYGEEVNLTNLSPSAPKQSDAVKFLWRSLGSEANLTKLFFYDDSAGTYTDYTAASSSTTENDIPLTGDVNDCYYFLSPTVAARTGNPALAVTLTAQSNDYEYIWERRRTNWFPMLAWDSTENFTKSGRVFLATPDSYWDSFALNGVTGYWYRLRIVAKGTTSPVATRIRSRSQLGIIAHKYNAQYSCDLKIVDGNGDPIEGANVNISNVLGTAIDRQTNASGDIASTDIKVATTALDPYASDADYNYSTTDLNPFTVIVTAAGYDPYTVIMDITQKLSQTIALEPAIPAPTCYFEVTDDMGEPLAGATVAVYSGEILVHTLTTNGAGETIAIAVDPINPFDVLVTATGYEPHSVKAELLNISKLSMSLDLLPPNPTYQFKVVNSAGDPVEGASVTIMDDEGAVLHELTTDDAGATIPFDVAALPEFVVVVTATGFTEYRATIEIAAEDTAITLGVATAPPTPVPVRAKVLELKSWL